MSYVGSSYRLALVLADEGGAVSTFDIIIRPDYNSPTRSPKSSYVPNALATKQRSIIPRWRNSLQTTYLHSKLRVDSLDTGPLATGMANGRWNGIILNLQTFFWSMCIESAKANYPLRER
jgi:hypothetical protein